MGVRVCVCVCLCACVYVRMRVRVIERLCACVRARAPVNAHVCSETVLPASLASLHAGAQVIFRVRRPFYVISSTIYVEDGEGNVIGEVRQRWHLWQRNYDLYVDKRQFATINGSFLAWEFVLQDRNGGTVHHNFPRFRKQELRRCVAL